MTETKFRADLSAAAQEDKQFKLGKAYYKGENIEQNCKLAWKLWLQLANQRHIEAQFELGKERYLNSKNINHYIKAVKWLRQAANKKHVGTLFYLGEAYFYGRGVTLNYVQALEQYEQADNELNDEQDDNQNYDDHILGEIKNRLEYDSSNEIKQCSITQQYFKAVKWSELANQGDIEAKYNLGVAFNNGEGVVENQDRAFELLGEAAEMGHSKAQVELGILYYKSKIVSGGYSKAMYWWHLAARQNNYDALFQIGLAYYRKKNENQSNLDLAIDWWEKAADKGQHDAQYHLGNAYYEGWGNKKPNETKAIEYWQQAAKQGHITAQYNLGVIYRKQSTAENYEKALEWFKEVAQNPNDNIPLVISAKYLLGTMYKNGQGCVQNLQEARTWLELVSKRAFKEIEGLSKSENDLLEVVLNEDKTQEELITIVQISAQEALEDIAKLEEQEKAKDELEIVMAMFAHKFRGPLRRISNNMEFNSPKQDTSDMVQTMLGLINIFSIISHDAKILCKELQQDIKGKGTLLTVLNKSLLLAIEQLLHISNIDIIRQHYFNYAKKTEQIEITTTIDEWEEEFLDLEKQLQASWLKNFKQLDSSNLEVIKIWIEERFFPLELIGFNDSNISFASYKAKESTLLIIMTEIILNAIKYYSSETNEAIKITWQQKTVLDKVFYTITCQNPSTREERGLTKGSYKGHIFLNVIANKLNGQFPEPVPNNPYYVEWLVPIDLFTMEKK